MLLDDLSSYLSPLVVYPVQKGQLLELPDTVVAMRETGGYASQYAAGSGVGHVVFDEPTLQVVTRAKDYQTAMSTCRTVYDLLNGLREQLINGVLYHFIRALQPPFFLMRDENKRYLCAFNIHVQRRSAT